MRYDKIVFTLGLACEAYREIDDNGNVLRFLGIDGNALDLPTPTESHVIDDSPALPIWATDNPDSGQ